MAELLRRATVKGQQTRSVVNESECVVNKNKKKTRQEFPRKNACYLINVSAKIQHKLIKEILQLILWRVIRPGESRELFNWPHNVGEPASQCRRRVHNRINK